MVNTKETKLVQSVIFCLGKLGAGERQRVYPHHDAGALREGTPLDDGVLRQLARQNRRGGVQPQSLLDTGFHIGHARQMLHCHTAGWNLPVNFLQHSRSVAVKTAAFPCTCCFSVLLTHVGPFFIELHTSVCELSAYAK